jgi:hypothetical protein
VRRLSAEHARQPAAQPPGGKALVDLGVVRLDFLLVGGFRPQNRTAAHAATFSPTASFY